MAFFWWISALRASDLEPYKEEGSTLLNMEIISDINRSPDRIIFNSQLISKSCYTLWENRKPPPSGSWQWPLTEKCRGIEHKLWIEPIWRFVLFCRKWVYVRCSDPVTCMQACTSFFFFFNSDFSFCHRLSKKESWNNIQTFTQNCKYNCLFVQTHTKFQFSCPSGCERCVKYGLIFSYVLFSTWSQFLKKLYI